ncbi:preQ(0) biosynthesis protein QueC [Leptonema illini DSM 21528]|jgi:7-cyano-7-deazaguanine synthase|uniref:7-cyano-7-deazaguanine synthase n=2 Tax=Leptonema illini TaxID=183 RepID=H2CAI6_9LEPT|nr:preQ(0) biosynthesis protein QueC [Leptonema illini DSM 21528]
MYDGSFSVRMAAVVLLSGGLDSVTTLFVAKAEGHEIYCISFDYGQRHRFELQCATEQARRAGALEHHTVKIDPVLFQDRSSHSATALIAGGAAVPENRSELLTGAAEKQIPVTYVPARNLLFLAYALSFAESRSAGYLYIGANALDYSGYPDCRPAFLQSFETTANLGTKAGIEGQGFSLKAPLVDDTKADIIRRGLKLGVDYSMTSSCYQPSDKGRPCGRCDSCLLREKGFAEVGVEDPLLLKDLA